MDVNGTTIHVLAAHPTPPSFDGAEQRNKRRNFDEIRLWADYVANRADYLYDDANFVILGDYNSDPLDGDSYPGAIDQLLDSPGWSTRCRARSEVPRSRRFREGRT